MCLVFVCDEDQRVISRQSALGACPYCGGMVQAMDVKSNWRFCFVPLYFKTKRKLLLHLLQDITSTSDGRNVTTNVHWTGSMSNNLVTFEGGFQLPLLPGGMYMGCPCDVVKSVQESKSFHLEFCRVESPGKRQRLVRMYDVEGLAVSSTYFYETKL